MAQSSNSDPTRPIVVWFRNDLRTFDQPALSDAAESGCPLVPIYILDEAAPAAAALGGASRWWLHHSLEALGQALAELGAPLILRRGASCDILAKLVCETNAQAVYCSRAFEPWAQDQERELDTVLRRRGGALRRFAGTLLHEPQRVMTRSGTPFKIYTPFWRTLSGLPMRACRPRPTALQSLKTPPPSDDLNSWNLRPTAPDWAGGLRAAWSPGEAAGQSRLAAFIATDVAAYNALRDRPDRQATSRLSPHLHFGEISAAQCWHAAQTAACAAPSAAAGVETFCKELVWREFAYHLLYHHPQMPDRALRSGFDGFPWRPDNAERAQALRAWQQGRTGYPIVDAGMRELWATGWMHNRVRMIAASFLTKHLLIPWQRGAAWFWDCLVDADLASNSAGWQWVAGSGTDAAPYFRIFNPVTQGRKFDPDGTYVKRWVPELRDVPARHVHAPWLCDDGVLGQAGVVLGATYPQPMVDHAGARSRALHAYEQIKVRS